MNMQNDCWLNVSRLLAQAVGRRLPCAGFDWRFGRALRSPEPLPHPPGTCCDSLPRRELTKRLSERLAERLSVRLIKRLVERLTEKLSPRHRENSPRDSPSDRLVRQRVSRTNKPPENLELFNFLSFEQFVNCRYDRVQCATFSGLFKHLQFD